MYAAIKEKFKSNPKLYYALSICATWGTDSAAASGGYRRKKSQ